MSLRVRVTLAILALVVATVAASGWLASRRVIDPLAREFRGALADQAAFIAMRWADGADVDELEDAFDVDLRPLAGPPRPVPLAQPPRRVRGPGRPMIVVPRAGSEIYVRTPRGWLAVAHRVDLDRPGRRLRLLLVLAGVGLTALAAGIAAAATRPLSVARDAMEEVARGDLATRIDEHGPSELRAVARSFNQMAERVQTLLRTERELLAGVSHELRTPMTRLRLALELLRDDGAPEKRIDGMLGDLTELEALIEDLLALSRMQLGDGVLSGRTVDLMAIALDVAAGIDVGRVSVTGTAEPFVGDPRLVRRALDNLVRNAVRHAPEGPIEVAVGPRSVAVRDRGPGVPNDALTRLFEPFYRADPSRSRATGGIGLGLMIVRQVAQLHGGRATAHLREGGGLEVQLELGPP